MSLQAETQNILSNFISALSVEIDSIKKYVQKVTAKNGSLLENIGGLFIYKFELDDSYDIPDDTQVQVRTGIASYQAVIINCKGLEIIISCEADLGKQIPSITILVSNANLLESLKRLMEEIQSEKIFINEDLVLKLFNNSTVSATSFPEYFIPPLKSI
ncbi:MAG: hypothetical protein IPJ03_20015 [Ignavibacteriales bacterium]|nr:hypothetical protein [Ignavibacteriales bacterium]